jgi:hypothetical protein
MQALKTLERRVPILTTVPPSHRLNHTVVYGVVRMKPLPERWMR